MLGAFVLSHVTNRETTISSLCFLLENDPFSFKAWMFRILPRVERFTEEARITVLAIAFALTPEETWDLVWPQIIRDEELAKKVILSVASNLEFEARKHPLALNANQYGKLAELLYSLFPPDAEVERMGGTVTPRQAVADYRRKVSDALTASTDPEAGKALLRLAAKFENEKIAFMWRYRDHLNTRRRTHWKSPSPNELNTLLKRPDSRFLSTDADLFNVVLESMRRFEVYYTNQVSFRLLSVYGDGLRRETSAQILNQRMRKIFLTSWRDGFATTYRLAASSLVEKSKSRNGRGLMFGLRQCRQIRVVLPIR